MHNFSSKMLSYMLLSALKPLEPWGISNTPRFTTFKVIYTPFHSLRPRFCFGGLYWTNIKKLKVQGFQKAIIITLEPLESQKMSNTPFLSFLCPFFCFRGLDWTNILKLKVQGFQNAIIHAYICSRTSRILEDVKHPPFCPFCALGDLIGQIGLKIEGPSFLKCYHTCLYLLQNLQNLRGCQTSPFLLLLRPFFPP